MNQSNMHCKAGLEVTLILSHIHMQFCMNVSQEGRITKLNGSKLIYLVRKKNFKFFSHVIQIVIIYR
jgi:hypothetical protein